jgi:hypothetical protein
LRYSAESDCSKHLACGPGTSGLRAFWLCTSAAPRPILFSVLIFSAVARCFPMRCSSTRLLFLRYHRLLPSLIQNNFDARHPTLLFLQLGNCNFRFNPGSKSHAQGRNFGFNAPGAIPAPRTPHTSFVSRRSRETERREGRVKIYLRTKKSRTHSLIEEISFSALVPRRRSTGDTRCHS